MDKNQILDDIFANDPLGLLEIKPKSSGKKTEEARLIDSFSEINAFFEANGKEPKQNITNVSEYNLGVRLKYIRKNAKNIEILQEYDIHNLLPKISISEVNEPKEAYQLKKEINSIDDIFNDDNLDIFGDDAGLFDFKNVERPTERDSADFVARRKPCKDFDKYEAMLKEVQHDLSTGKRRLIDFKLGNLRAGEFYVHNGVVFFLESIDLTRKDHYKEDGTRVRKDGRTRCIFENGTESNMLMRSVEKILYANGKAISHNADKSNEAFLKVLNSINNDDKEAGFIYVLKSQSKDPQVANLENLYKIGYSGKDVENRIKNAANEPTYLMSEVEYITGWQCFNLNPQKFEQLIHNFFGASCLEIDVYDEQGRRHTPREWFVVPLEVIEEAVNLIISGEVVNYRYNAEMQEMVRK